MKTKVVVIIGLALQLGFLFFFLVQAPEPDEAMQVGMRRLKDEVPAQAPLIKPRADGTRELKTAGDFFDVANIGYRFLIRGAQVFMVLSIFISVSFLVTLRRKPKSHDLPVNAV